MDKQNIIEHFGESFANLKANSFGFASKESVKSSELAQFFSKPEVLRLISTVLGLATSCAVAYYSIRYLVEHMDPTREELKKAEQRAQAVLTRLGMDSSISLSSYELAIAADLIDPATITTTWKDIGGLDDIITELKESVLFQFQYPDITRNSRLLQAPKGILLYGPPGCGKTLIARAIAKEVGAKLINLQVTSLLDKWYGESQKRTEALFSLATKFQPVIIFIDEIDSFLSSRDRGDQESTGIIKTQFMTMWDGLVTDPDAVVIVLGATNRKHAVDPAILRRMPCQLCIGLPGLLQRRQILKVILNKERNVPVSVMDNLEQVARVTDGFSGSDILEVCRMAAVSRLKTMGYFDSATDSTESMPENNCLITLQGLLEAVQKLRTSRSNTHLFQPSCD